MVLANNKKAYIHSDFFSRQFEKSGVCKEKKPQQLGNANTYLVDT